MKKQTNSDREFPTVNCGLEKAGLKSAIRNPQSAIRRAANVLWWLILTLVLPPPIEAQTVQIPRVSDLRFSAGVQLVGIYTGGAQADINGDRRLEDVANRFDFSARRARFSISGRVTEGLDLDFRIVFYYDNLGRDRFTGGQLSREVPLFVRVSGPKSGGISVMGNDLRLARKLVDVTAAAEHSSVTLSGNITAGKAPAID